MTKTKLTQLQQRFVRAYAGEARGVGSEAARLAGYKGNTETLASMAYELLRKPSVLIAIEELNAEDPLVMTAVQLQRLWTTMALNEGLEARDRLKATELLGRAMGMFINRTEITGKDGAPIEHQHSQGPDLSKMSTEQLREYKAHMEAAAAVITQAGAEAGMSSEGAVH